MNRRGFSLIEIVVVLGVISVATALGTSAFSVMNTNMENLRTRADINDQARQAFDSIRRDVENVLSPALSGVTFSHTRNTHTGVPVAGLHVSFSDDTITLPVYAPVGVGGEVVSAQVRYAVSRSEGRFELVRTTGSLYDGPPKANPLTVAEGIAGIRFEFKHPDESGWVSEWDSSTLPRAIRVSVLVVDPNNPLEQGMRTAVMGIHVQ